MELKQNIWVYIELVKGELTPLSIELLGKGRELADAHKTALAALLIGDDVAGAAEKAIGYGADAAVIVHDPALAEFDAALYTKVTEQIVKKYEPSVLLIVGSCNGRDLGGRLSAALRVGLVADCIDVLYEGSDDTLTWIRPAYTGKLFVKIQTTTRPQLATISDKIFHGNAFDGGRQGQVIAEAVDLGGAAPLQKIVDFKMVPPEQAVLDLDTADVIVGAGRGVGDEEGLAKVKAFADSIGAAFGVSKPIVDNGWASHDIQVGITGKKVAPKIYIALGISGAIQHKLGIQDAEIIIAVNKDPDAPIFKFAHYGIVGDLFEAMPALEAELKKVKK